MKNVMKLMLIIVVGLFLSSCTAAQKGAGIGGLAGMAGSAIGKGDRKTTAIAGGIGAVVGYLIGNEVDKSQPQQHIQPQQSGSPRTDCRKIVTRRTVGGVTTETIQEDCTGQKTTQTY